jgi:hypothetical protein
MSIYAHWHTERILLNKHVYVMLIARPKKAQNDMKEAGEDNTLDFLLKLSRILRLYIEIYFIYNNKTYKYIYILSNFLTVKYTLHVD